MRKVYENGRQFQNVNELKAAIIRAHESIPRETFHNLIRSMPNRIFEIIRKNGDKIDY